MKSKSISLEKEGGLTLFYWQEKFCPVTTTSFWRTSCGNVPVIQGFFNGDPIECLRKQLEDAKDKLNQGRDPIAEYHQYVLKELKRIDEENEVG